MTMTIQSLYLRSCYCIILHCIVRRCRTKFRVTPTTFPCRLPYRIPYICILCMYYLSYIISRRYNIYFIIFFFNYYSIIPGLGVNQVKGPQTFLAYCTCVLAYSRTRVAYFFHPDPCRRNAKNHVCRPCAKLALLN